MKIFKDTEPVVREALNSINSHFGFPSEFIRTYSRMIEYEDAYGFTVNLEGKYDASDLIDISKVEEYIEPEIPEEVDA